MAKLGKGLGEEVVEGIIIMLGGLKRLHSSSNLNCLTAADVAVSSSQISLICLPILFLHVVNSSKFSGSAFNLYGARVVPTNFYVCP